MWIKLLIICLICIKKVYFLQLQNYSIKVFLPFSKHKFRNNFAHKIKVNPRLYLNINDFIQYTQELEGRTFKKRFMNQNIEEWWAGGDIFRYDRNEGESGVAMMRDMFKEVCKSRKVPDFVECFINRRDHPLLRKDGTEAYHQIHGNQLLPTKYMHNSYSPILSMVTHPEYADIPIPTWYDWDRANPNCYFPRNGEDFNYDFSLDFNSRKSIAIFRGASTGHAHNNIRIKAAQMKHQHLDAGITNWKCRPRLNIAQSPYLQTIDKSDVELVSYMSPEEQCKYKYILNIPGHVCAFRLSLELSMGSVVLLVDSDYKLWFHQYLIATDIYNNILGHYIPIKNDLSNLIEVIEWCVNHDEECKIIVDKAKQFYQTYLTRDGILDYLANILWNIQCAYSYLPHPLLKQLPRQEKIIQRMINKFPIIDTIAVFPPYQRDFNLHQAIQWAFYLSCPTNLRSFKQIQITEFANTTLCVKEIKNIHEGFIGLMCINPITLKIPNFIYTFGIKENKVFTEYIQGQTMLDFLLSDKFNTCQYFEILLQISLALHVAQQDCSFIHFDLYPWNIILKEEERIIDYPINDSEVIRIKTSVIPVIIDYGRSQVKYKQNTYGYSAPPLEVLKYSTFQDILTLLVSSLSTILRSKYQSKRWREVRSHYKKYVKLANIIGGTSYAPTFYNLPQIKKFVKYAKNLSTLLLRPRDTILDSYTCLNFFDKVNKLTTFEFTKSKLKSKRKKKSKSLKLFRSFSGVILHKFLQCKLPKPDNLETIKIAYKACIDNLELYKTDPLYHQCIKKVENFYQPLLKI